MTLTLYTSGAVEGVPFGIPVSIPVDPETPVPTHATIENGWSAEIPGFESWEDGNTVVPCDPDDIGAMPYADAYYLFYQDMSEGTLSDT
tara:strand:- start:7305 stop:7571 length:267 start_codon:yes stop_codon:yes gene_type:complete